MALPIRPTDEPAASLCLIASGWHALLAAVDRLLVLHGGKFIAAGDPRSVIRSPQVAEIYMGIAADA